MQLGLNALVKNQLYVNFGLNLIKVDNVILVFSRKIRIHFNFWFKFLTDSIQQNLKKSNELREKSCFYYLYNELKGVVKLKFHE